MGIAVAIVSTGSTEATPIWENDEYGIDVLRLPSIDVPIGGSTFPIPKGPKQLVKEFLRADVIMAHTRFFLTTILAARIAKELGKRIHVLDHGAGPLRSNPLFAAASTIYECAITESLRRFSPRFYGVSSTSLMWLTRFGIWDAKILPNGVDPIHEPVNRAMENHPVVFYAGRMLPDKGVMELIEAVRMLVSRWPAIELRLAGPGPLARRLTQLATRESFLSYLGPISAQQVADELRRTTVLVNPSKLQEGCPTILLEAANAAVPVISTASGAADLIQDGETGWLVQTADPRSIADAMDAVLSEPTEANRRGHALLDLVQSRYTWPAIVQRFLEYASA